MARKTRSATIVKSKAIPAGKKKMSKPKNITCYYNSLVGLKTPQRVDGAWIDVHFRNLDPLEKYTAEFFLWAKEDRPLRIEILKPDESDVIKGFQFKLEPKKDSAGKGVWTAKKYALGPTRQNGKARIVIGWSPNHKLQPKVPFLIAANTLIDKGISPTKRIAAGLCPVCAKPGQWQAMAMVCLDHGRFIG